MVKESVRTHVVLPRSVVDEVDRIAGKRRRSEFITDAVQEKLTRELQLRALDEAAGALKNKDYPDWQTPEKTSAWIRSLRDESDRSIADKLRGEPA
ncbi:MAG TPA: ribbon-helix-helix domain-containing protein [Dehalococcoidia bacterium]|jgi:Arc/MetJ-type ribon-helix-helix transcriptional regulator|nr:ribbon-helix-helix domain-containing protein [Dehalococcoidia bacterium]